MPDEVTSIVRLLRPPAIPEVPEPLRDRPVITIGAACVGDRENGERLVAPLLEIGEPIMSSLGQIPAAGLCRIHMDPEQPVPGIGHHMTIAELPDAAMAPWRAGGGYFNFADRPCDVDAILPAETCGVASGELRGL